MHDGQNRGIFEVAGEVAAALDDSKPVVALESTLITHGFPRPEGLELGLELEAVVRHHGAVPATIGVLAGRLIVGLSPAEIEQLAAAPQVEKLNPANLAAGVASGHPGSTTVAATLGAAHLAGIRVFSTGGIGGVHRGVEDSGDISADLDALARTPLAVVCAGAKAVLDLPRTLEALETRGVPVLGFQTRRFPAFYRRDSGLPVDSEVPDLETLVRTLRIHFEVAPATGVVVANPIPAAHEMAAEVYEGALDRALCEAREQAVHGRALTPFLLERMRLLTEGQSAFANRALLTSNARLAARLAVGLAAETPTT